MGEREHTLVQMARREEEPQTTFLTPEQAAIIAGVNTWTLYRWLNSGKLPGYRAGGHGHWRILPSDLTAFLLSSHEGEKPVDISWSYSYDEVKDKQDDLVLDEDKQDFWRYASAKQYNATLQEQAGTFPPPPQRERWRVQLLLNIHALYAANPKHRLTAGELRTMLENVQALYKGE